MYQNDIPTVHLNMLKKVAGVLKASDLLNKFVFVGGCTTFLFVDRAAQAQIRSTEDVDLIVSVISRGEHYQLQKQLKQHGFIEKIPIFEKDAHICSLYLDSIRIDLMPTDEVILGFSNQWYPSAFTNFELYNLGDNIEIQLINPVYFLATKLEAFHGRGNNDILGSKDIEDIFIVLNGRGQIIDDLLNSKNTDVVKFIQKKFLELRKNDYLQYKFAEYLNSEERINTIISLSL